MNNETQEMDFKQETDETQEPEQETDEEQAPEREANGEQAPEQGNHNGTQHLTRLLAGVLLAAVAAAGAVFVMNGLLIRAKVRTEEAVTGTAQETAAESASISGNAIVSLAEDLLVVQEDAGDEAVTEKGTDEADPEQEQTENTDAAGSRPGETDQTGEAGAGQGQTEGADAASGESAETPAAGQTGAFDVVSSLSGEGDVAQEGVSQEETAKGTGLLENFEDRYGTVVPKNMTASECIEALAELAEQYPEFEEIYENREDYPIVLLIALCNNPEMIDFALGYPDADTETAGELTQEEIDSDFPYYLQWDSRWGYLSYGDTNIGLSGCGPTCLSMVIVKLTGNAEATPAAVAEYAMQKGYYVSGAGTAWALMTTGASHFGITGKTLSTSVSEEKLLALLEDGYPVICSVKQGDFTKGGHFIVLAGVENGKIRVYDPNSVERSSRLWDYETLISQVKKMWVYEVSE